MDYTAVRRTGAQTLTYSTRSGMETPIFYVGKILYFSLWKNQGFLCWPSCTGHWTGQRDSSGQLDSGQWTVDSGQWTVDSGQTDCPVVDNGTLYGSSCTGQTQPGAAGQWTLDKWTVDGTEWTEVLSLL